VDVLVRTHYQMLMHLSVVVVALRKFASGLKLYDSWQKAANKKYRAV
jgi:hypothetical protein